MLWAVLACVAIPYYWKLLEPPGTYRTLGFSWMCPAPQYLKCMAALVCRSPPFHTFYSHALGCVGMRCHSPYYWKLLEPPGTYRTLGFSWMCPAPQYLVQPYISGTGGQGTSRRILGSYRFQVVPIVSSSREWQRMPTQPRAWE